MALTYYETELGNLRSTYEKALGAEISRLKGALAGASDSSVISVGSGGSFTVGSLLCDLHESYTGRVSRPSTPLEIICRPALASASPVFLISAEGKNPDIVEALQRARQHSSRAVHVITNRSDSRLVERARQLSDISVHVFELEEKDGYLATNSLLLDAVLVARAYGELDGDLKPVPPSAEALRLNDRTIESWLLDAGSFVQEAISRGGVIVVYSPLLRAIGTQTDVVLDVSSLPRVVYLALMTGLLGKIVWDKKSSTALRGDGINFQVLVADDAALDAQIRAEEPSNDLILIPGFSSALHAESLRDWPLVWFPILGEKRSGQLQKIMATVIPDDAEICPVVPHPSRDPRRADQLIIEYKTPLFESRPTPDASIMYVDESNPFEVYRQLLGAMKRYRESLELVGGCRLFITPLASKLITLGAGLACFEMRPEDTSERYAVAIPYVDATRYDAPVDVLLASKPEVSSMLLTGEAYDQNWNQEQQ